jgi:hypothetical protein
MPAYSRKRIRQILRDADAARTTEAKGRLFEDLVCYLFGKIPGMTLFQRDVLNRFESEEVDVAFWNEQERKGLKSFPHFLLIECKNWSVPVGCSAGRDFLGKLRNRGLDFGILIAAHGVTGSPEDGKAAHQEVALALAQKMQLIVITRAEIETLKTTDDLVVMIKRKVCQLLASGTVWP